ncbi:MAG: phage major capsid protein [Clostridia bacterium]|nr:phage major capsid protein [Clostridia bacterium]MBQ6613777.1 phage major capsid protein [Clostridia bacterium]
MAQILTKLEAILKDKYQPALTNQIGTEPSPFLEKIKKVALTNNTIKCAAPVGINGGFGFGAEGVGTPKAGAQRYTRFEIDAVDMYVDLQISNKTIELASNNASSMINALDSEIKGSYAAAKWNIGRALFGDGTGKLATVTAVQNSGANTLLTLDSAKRVIEGLAIDLYDASATSVSALNAANAGHRILSVDRAAKTITVEGNLVLTEATGFITVQGSFNRELCGLGAIFGDGEKLYGIVKADNPWICPTTVDAGGDITDLILYRGIKEAKDYKGSNIDLLMMGDNAFLAYQDYIHTNNVTVTDKYHFVGGAVGYKILVGSNEVIIVNERFVPENEVWGVDTSAFYLEATPWNFMEKDGGVFVPMPDTSIFRALLASYGNLMCTNPGGCVRFVNAAQ